MKVDSAGFGDGFRSASTNAFLYGKKMRWLYRFRYFLRLGTQTVIDRKHLSVPWIRIDAIDTPMSLACDLTFVEPFMHLLQSTILPRGRYVVVFGHEKGIIEVQELKGEYIISALIERADFSGCPDLSAVIGALAILYPTVFDNPDKIVAHATPKSNL